MTNLASVLKSEIARVARKEVRSETEGLKKASAGQRTAIAQLRRQIADLERALKVAQRASTRADASASPDTSRKLVGVTEDEKPRRFSASRLEAHRKKLKLSAADYGKLVGVSGQAVYNWEQGKSRPAPKMVQMLGWVKQQSPKAILARMAELSTPPAPVDDQTQDT